MRLFDITRLRSITDAHIFWGALIRGAEEIT